VIDPDDAFLKENMTEQGKNYCYGGKDMKMATLK
jgi:hypothetical protein